MKLNLRFGLVLASTLEFMVFFMDYGLGTPPNSEIMCVQNVGAKVEMVSYFKK